MAGLFGNLWAGDRLTYGQLDEMAGEVEPSTQALVQSYEWRVAQMSACGTAFLTATLGILATIVTEAVKKAGVGGVEPQLAWSAAAGSLSGIIVFLICQLRIRQLRREFLELYYTLLLLR